MRKSSVVKKAAALALSAALLSPVCVMAKGADASTGYGLKRVVLYRDGALAMDLDSLQAEVDFATVDGTSGVRLHIDNEDTEVAWIAASLVQDAVLITLHGGISDQTATYKVTPQALVRILDSDAFKSLIGGESSETEQEAEDVPEEAESGSEEPGTEGIGAGSAAGLSADEAAGTKSADEAASELSAGETEEDRGSADTEGPGGADEAVPALPGSETEEDRNSADMGAETVEPAAKEASSGGIQVKKYSLEDIVSLISDINMLISDSIVKDRVVDSEELGRITFNGVSLDAEHMAQLLDKLAAMGMDGNMAEALKASGLEPKGLDLVCGTGENYSSIELSIGLKQPGREAVWAVAGGYKKDDELLLGKWNLYGESGERLDSGTEIVFGESDPGEDAFWMPTEDEDVIDLASLEPEEAIGQFTEDLFVVLSDVLGGVMPVLMDELPEELITDLFGIRVSGENTVPGETEEPMSETDEALTESAEEEPAEGAPAAPEPETN